MRRVLQALCVSLIVAAPLGFSRDAGASAPDSGRGSPVTLRSCVNEFSPARIESTKAGYQYWFIGRHFLDGRTVKMSAVRPHTATHPPHRHGEDEIFFILEGSAEVFLNGERKVLHPYATFYCPPGSEHGIRNVGDSELKYLVLKTIAGD